LTDTVNTLTEIWVKAPRFPDYEVSSLGRVRRLTTRTSTLAGRILRPSLHYRGYLHHGLASKGKTVTVRLNRLVCEAFHGPAPSHGHQAAHCDGDRMNNAASNLRWATKLENENDKNIHGTRRRGTAAYGAKLTEGIVAEIRRRAQRGQVSALALSKEFNLPVGPVRHVLKGRSWPHVRVST